MIGLIIVIVYSIPCCILCYGFRYTIRRYNDRYDIESVPNNHTTQ